MDHILLTSIFLIFDDEALPTINKPKHPKKEGGEYEEQKWKDLHPRRQMNHVRGPTDKGNIKFMDPLLFARSRSNNERGGPSEMRPGLEKPSPTATAHLRIEIACRHIVTTSLTLSAYKMHAKLREEGFRYPSLPHTMLA